MIRISHKKKRQFTGYLLTVLVFAFCIALFLIGTKAVAKRTKDEQLRALEEAVRHASVQCYAIEGRYPPSVEYLEEHYGLSIDRNKYNVFYDGWASNLMPDITIFPADE